MSTEASLKDLKRTIIDRYVKPNNLKGLFQAANTILPIVALWYCIALSAQVSYWLTAGIIILMCLFLVRVFVLMHECGHGSLFRTGRLNKGFGFFFGVLAGMPQYVWSQHHAYHHSTNGNWAKYRGPLSIIEVDEYAKMSAQQQRRYRNARALWLAPIAGFLYLIVNPRVSWLRGCFGLARHVIKRKLAEPNVSVRTHALSFKTPCWGSPEEAWHMFWNNVVLLALWVLMAWWIGPLLFFVCMIISVSVAGGVGILVFTVQHNFEHSYASGNDGWDYDQAAIEGTSYLVLPTWLNWFTANIAYHHVHHLSARIPNYCLLECHTEYQHLFSKVARIRLAEIPHALSYILWDTRARRIVSVAEVEQRLAA